MDDWVPNGWAEMLAALGVIAVAVKVFDWRVRLHIDQRLLFVKNELRKEIRHTTQLIQPGVRNGGSSLADIGNRLGRLEEKLGIGE